LVATFISTGAAAVCGGARLTRGARTPRLATGSADCAREGAGIVTARFAVVSPSAIAARIAAIASLACCAVLSEIEVGSVSAMGGASVSVASTLTRAARLIGAGAIETRLSFARSPGG
jgi:hypothetical protein